MILTSSNFGAGCIKDSRDQKLKKTSVYSISLRLCVKNLWDDSDKKTMKRQIKDYGADEILSGKHKRKKVVAGSIHGGHGADVRRFLDEGIHLGEHGRIVLELTTQEKYDLRILGRNVRRKLPPRKKCRA